VKKYKIKAYVLIIFDRIEIKLYKMSVIIMKFNDWLKDVLRLECLLFSKTDIYRLIEQRQNEKCLKYDERKELYMEIHSVFQRLINILEESCPNLTKEDLIFCCLVKSGLGKSIIGYCTGSVSSQAFNQRKYRIKKKMKEMKCEELFELLYQSNDFV
jgi:hypothetical protein